MEKKIIKSPEKMVKKIFNRYFAAAAEMADSP